MNLFPGFAFLWEDRITKKEPTMVDALRSLDTLSEDIQHEVNEQFRDRPRRVGAEDLLHQIPPPVNWRRTALGTIADMCVHLTYGEMMDMAAGLSLSVEDVGKQSAIDVDSTARSIHHWAKNFKEDGQ